MLLRYLLLGLLFRLIGAYQNTSNALLEAGDDDPYYPSLEWSDVFDWKVLTVLSENKSNVLFSPASLKLVLGILYEGSSGSTQRQFENALQFLSKGTVRNKTQTTLDVLQVSPSSANILKLSTRLFLDSDITVKSTFAKKIEEYYNATIAATNFSDADTASKSINIWASESTLGALDHLTDPEEVKDMIMLLANTIYFKGVWRFPFAKNNTCIGGFYVNPTTKIYIPYMTATNLYYYFESQALEAKILRMPYKGGRFAMIFVLPLSKGGLPFLMENINLQNLHRELYYLDRKLVLVSIPKFSFKLKASYKDVLERFGLRKIFENSASFPGIAEGNNTILRQLVVSDILQSTGIEIDEEGSIAFAATDVVIGNKIGVPDNTFNASHPFLFFIQDEASGTILFLGKIENPIYQDLKFEKLHDDIKKEFMPSQTSKPPNQT